MKKLLKYFLLFVFGGCLYGSIELISRGRTHCSMIILGGICFIAIGLIDEVIPWSMKIRYQMLIGCFIITTLELITGYIVNIKLGWNVWDYSDVPFNFKGQICLDFSLIWYLLSLVAIVLDDWMRYWFFHEERPHYKF